MPGIGVLDSDILVFSDDQSGDDALIAERKRILAAIDFPRPEMIINTFSFQTSSSNPEVIAASDQNLRSGIGHYNDALQLGLYRAWFYLECRISDPNFFDKTFHNYFTQHSVAEPYTSDAKGSLHTSIAGSESGLCPPNQYCLGFTSLFNPLRPILTDLLFAVVALQNPSYEFRLAIEQMGGLQIRGKWAAEPAVR